MSKTKPKRGVSASAAAAHIFVSSVTFAKLLNEGVIKREPRDVGYNLNLVRQARFRQLEKVAAGRGGENADALTDERVKLTRAKRKREEMQAEIEAGQWARLATVRRFLEGAILAFRDRVLNLPGEAAYALAMRPQQEVFEILDDMVRAKLEELADPAGTAARAAAAGVESNNGEAHRSDDDDDQDKKYAAEPS
jgi:phage terminase Nu1 subunit (DNA packaging protein)